MANIKIDSSEFKDLIRELDKMPEVVMKQAYPFYKSKTPVRSGNARNKTKLERKLTIKSNYPYAGRLDEGWSKQSPEGFTDPTSDKLEEYVNNYVKKVS